MLYPALASRLSYQHTALAEIISGAGETNILARPEPNKWNVHEQITHLTTYQPLFIKRLHLILDEQEPTFPPYKADVDPEFLQCLNSTDQELIEKINAGRTEIIRLVESMNDDQLSRTGVHMVYGRFTITQWLEFFLLHEAHHLFAIFKLLHSQKG
jgi:uncharacterized damage-inducible protein DinB